MARRTALEIIEAGMDRPGRRGLSPRPPRGASSRTCGRRSTIIGGKVFAPRLSPSCCPRSQRAREIWLTRSRGRPAASGRHGGRSRSWRDKITEREVGRHIARFILVGLYTGTRHAAICAAAFHACRLAAAMSILSSGVFYRRAQGARETKKRQPPVRLPDRLLAHLRRWHRLGIAKHAVVEWNGKPVRSVRKGSLPPCGGRAADTGETRSRRTSCATPPRRGRCRTVRPLGSGRLPRHDCRDVTARYGHHHPDFQRDAAEAVASSPGQKRDRNPVNKTRQMAMNVTKTTDFSRGGR